MHKKLLTICFASLLACSFFAGCGKQEVVSPNITIIESEIAETTEATEASTEAEVEIDRTGMYRSELTNEWIDESIKNQRPVAIIVDNEKTALDHYGLTQADIVYELMNSTANSEVTRLMCIVKDWGAITRFGSIRSARPSHFMIAPEYNAVVIHDGGPYYIDAFKKNPWVTNLSGDFARITNGKAKEFTEYVTTGEIEARMKANNYSMEYTEYYNGARWQFADDKDPVNLADRNDSIDCTLIGLPFPHNDSELKYDKATNTYLYSEYGMAHIDPENDNKQLAFTNVFIQCAELVVLDDNGYMQFNLINNQGDGYYITGGKAIPVTWTKAHDTNVTQYYTRDGKEVIINTGKTYIGIVADTRWDELVIK